MSLTKYFLDKRVLKSNVTSFVGQKNLLDLAEYIQEVVDDSTIDFTSIIVDTLAEKTAAHGVIVDSVTLKDGGILLDDGTVTQGTSVTTTVVLDKPAGIVSCFTSTAAAGVHVKFTVTNSFATASSVILANVCDYSGAVDGSAGQPTVYVDNITSGAFDLIVYNSDSTQALAGVVKVAFAILG